MVPLSFQPYAESEKQNNPFHQLKREVTSEGFRYDATERSQLQASATKGYADWQASAIC